MNQVIPYPLWIGHAGDGRDFLEIFDKGIQSILQLALEEPPLQAPRELIYLRFPLLDGSGNDPAVLQLAIHCVAFLMKQNTPTLVCCGGGMSRSPAIVAAALATFEHVDVEECLKRVTQSHPADLSPSLWKDIRHIVGNVQPNAE